MFSFRKCNEKGWRSTLSTFPRLEKSKTIAFVRDRHLSWPSITYSFRDTAVFAKRVCQIEIHKTNSLSVLYHRKRAFKQLCESLLPSKFQYKIKEVKIQNIGGSQISCIFWVKYMHERGRKRVDFLSSLQRTALKWKRLGKRKCRLDSAAFETIDQRKMAMKRRSGQGGQKGEVRQMEREPTAELISHTNCPSVSDMNTTMQFALPTLEMFLNWRKKLSWKNNISKPN